ncbi:hypothetical protein D3C87_1938090 [compost metagenome]
MQMKKFLTSVLGIEEHAPTVIVKTVPKATSAPTRIKRGYRVINLEQMQPTARPSAEDIEERVRRGCVAEMSLHHAGL